MKLKEKLTQQLDKRFLKYGWYLPLKNDYIARTVFLSGFGTVFTALFAVYNAIYAHFVQSLWFGALAAYLLILALQRLFVIVFYRIAKRRAGEDGARFLRAKEKIELASGCIFLVLTVAVFTLIGLFIRLRKPVVADEILAISTAAYAFIKVGMAIYHFIKARRIKDPVLTAVRNACLLDALVSILMLESTLITTFGSVDEDMYILMAVSGIVLGVFSLVVSMCMIVFSIKRLRQK